MFIIVSVLFSAALFSLSPLNAIEIDWRATVLPPIDHSKYRSLRACVSNNNEHDVAACFINVTRTPSPLTTLKDAGHPSLLFVPDCLESVLQSSPDGEPLFAATTSTFPRLVSLHDSIIPESLSSIEVAHPSRRIPGGSYSILVKQLLKVGYVDGTTMRAAAWDWRLPINDAVIRISTLLDDSDLIVVGRGAGCALGARAAASKRIRALLCLSEPTDETLPAGLHANELGLVKRRRGRPIPIVSGPWGDGAGPVRCQAHKTIDAVDAASLNGAPVLCADNCRRWLNGAIQEECVIDGELVDELDCLVRALIALPKT